MHLVNDLYSTYVVRNDNDDDDDGDSGVNCRASKCMRELNFNPHNHTSLYTTTFKITFYSAIWS